MVLQLLRDQVPVGDLDLLLLRVPWKAMAWHRSHSPGSPGATALLTGRTQSQWVLGLE